MSVSSPSRVVAGAVVLVAPLVASLVALLVALLGAGSLGACSLGGLEATPSDAGPDAAPMDAAKKTDGGTRPDGCASVDCDDLACRSAGYSCTGAAVPAGWTLVAYSPDDRPVCPSGFEGEQAVVSDVAGGAASCSCVCGGGPAQCVGTTVYNGYYENSCSTGS